MLYDILQHDVISCAKEVENLESQLAARMEQLQATVQSKTAVPTAQVYVSYTVNNIGMSFQLLRSGQL